MKIVHIILNVILIVIAIGLPRLALGDIREANSMEEVLKTFRQYNSETLGVFDIDMVLVHTTVPAYQMPNMKRHKGLLKELLEPLTQTEKDLALNLIVNSSETALIDSKTPEIINEIFKLTPKLITLTGSLSGALGNVKNMTESRYRALKACGLDFSRSFPALQEMTFKNIQSYLGNYPEYYRGIFSANGGKKGIVLIEFLKMTHYVPKTVIFIDDRDKNVEEVGEAIARFNPNIHFVGIVYKGAERFPSKPVSAADFKAAWLSKIEAAKGAKGV